MFSLINEVTNNFSAQELKNAALYKIINIGGKALYVQGYKSIEKFSDINIVLKIKNGSIFIKGEKLFVKELDSSSIYIVGTITGIEVQEWKH